MTFINFHTHRPAYSGERVIQDGVDTWGIHPWHAHRDFQFDNPNILAVGECGLDRACATPWEVQLSAFQRCISLSEQLHKPLILHCVRALDDCLLLRRRLSARQPWIYHGFRGSERKLAHILDAGLYACFGFHFMEDAVKACPPDRLLLESDEDERNVRELYHKVSRLRGISLESLRLQMEANYHTLIP